MKLTIAFLQLLPTESLEGNLKKGSKILPMYAINQLSKIGDPEMEVIFDARKLKKHIGFYEY